MRPPLGLLAPGLACLVSTSDAGQEPFCCTSAADNSSWESFCRTCYVGARNDRPGSFCSASEENCMTCGQRRSWCTGDRGGEASSVADPAAVYTALVGDCPGNNIDSLPSGSLADCAGLCSDEENCVGFSFRIEDGMCITKSKACSKPTDTDEWAFYVKGPVESTTAPSTTVAEPTIVVEAVEGEGSSSVGFCCMSAQESDNVCSTCWESSRAADGYCGLSADRCGSCGKTWCVGASTADPNTTLAAVNTTEAAAGTTDAPSAREANYTKQAHALCHDDPISDTLEDSRSACEALCSEEKKCNGYSWEQQESRCILTQRPAKIAGHFQWWDCFAKVMQPQSGNKAKSSESATERSHNATQPSSGNGHHESRRANSSTTTLGVVTFPRIDDASHDSEAGSSHVKASANGSSRGSERRHQERRRAHEPRSPAKPPPTAGARRASPDDRAHEGGEERPAGDFCCLKAHAHEDVCSTCYQDARVGSDVFCGKSEGACHACGKTWCSGRSSTQATTSTVTSTNTTTSASSTTTVPPHSCAAFGCGKANSTRHCQCDVGCIERQDCCADFVDHCVSRVVMKKYSAGGYREEPAGKISLLQIVMVAGAVATLAPPALLALRAGWRRLGAGASVLRMEGPPGSAPLVGYTALRQRTRQAAFHEDGATDDGLSEWEHQPP